MTVSGGDCPSTRLNRASAGQPLHNRGPTRRAERARLRNVGSLLLQAAAMHRPAAPGFGSCTYAAKPAVPARPYDVERQVCGHMLDVAAITSGLMN